MFRIEKRKGQTNKKAKEEENLQHGSRQTIADRNFVSMPAGLNLKALFPGVGLSPMTFLKLPVEEVYCSGSSLQTIRLMKMQSMRFIL